MRLAERCGLTRLISKHVRVAHRCGVNAHYKIGSIVAGMLAGADSIDDLDVIRHGGMGKLFAGIRAPSTLGSFLRCLSWGHVRQIEGVGRVMLARLAGHTPLLPGADVVAFLDLDSTQKRIYGPTKQGAGFGHTKIQGKSVLVRGLNVLAAAVSTPLAAPVIAAARLRGGTANSARGAASFVAEAINTAREAGCVGVLVVRGDSAYYAGKVVAACRRAGARFSFTVTMNPKVRATIATIGEQAWRPIRYPNAIYDEASGRWISDAEVAETSYTALAGTRHAVTARLIVRRVKDLNAATDQGELFTAWRYHAVFTDSPHELLSAEAEHRGHAIVEQVFADLYDGPLAHLPSGSFAANAAWLACAAIAHNLLRAAGTMASAFHARARGATLRRHLIDVPAEVARHGRGHITLHMPERWPWQDAFDTLFRAAHAPPPQAA